MMGETGSGVLVGPDPPPEHPAIHAANRSAAAVRRIRTSWSGPVYEAWTIEIVARLLTRTSTV